jgi:hypothetical protein
MLKAVTFPSSSDCRRQGLRGGDNDKGNHDDMSFKRPDM